MADATDQSSGGEGFSLRDFYDEDRMNFMYSAFPKDRNINPRHWDSKMNYWIDEIKRCCLFYRDVCISCKVLRERFCMTDGRTPNGLNIVISQMERQGLLTNKEHFLRSIGDNWLGWAYSLVKGSTNWLWSTVFKSNIKPEHEDYVVVNSLNALGMELLSKHFELVKFKKTDHVVPWRVVKSYYITSKPHVEDEELLLILAHLKSQRHVELATNSQGEKLIKFAYSLDSAVEKVNSNDWDIMRLKKGIAKLKIQIVDEEKEISKLRSEAISCFKQTNNMQAKRLMFQVKKLERSLDLKQDSLLTLTDNLTTIQNADSNKMILDAISSSSAALNASLHENELSPELASEVIEKSIEAVETAKEIESNISQGLIKPVEDDSDVQELEQELRKLLSEDDMIGKERSEESVILPKVPERHTPEKRTEKENSAKRTRVLAT